MTRLNPDRLIVFLERFPLLLPTLRTLNAADIPFAIGGSGCLFVLGNERLPDDVDIYLPNDRHDEADRLFKCTSYQYRSEQEDVRNSNPEGNHAIQLTSALVLTAAGRRYDLSLTSEVLAHRLVAELAGERVFFYPPEDVLLIKALLQRGADVGKHDVEDIRNFLACCPQLRRDYLDERLERLGARERVTGYL
jgi:hypothetical protein